MPEKETGPPEGCWYLVKREMQSSDQNAFPIKTVPRNQAGRDFVMGDIHGEFDLLVNGLDEVCFDPMQDRLFSVGDLIDRGPKSLECLQLIREPWFFAVVGNHEDMMFEEVLGRSYCGIRTWMMNGGTWWRKYKDDLNARKLVAEAYRTLPLALQIDHSSGPIGIVHASPPGSWTSEGLLDRLSQSHILWDRRIIENGDYEYESLLPAPLKRLYMGHTPQPEPLRMNGLNWIDTGAVYTGTLTIEEL